MEKITKIANDFIKGNTEDFKQEVTNLKPLEVLNLIEELSIFSGSDVGETLRNVKRVL